MKSMHSASQQWICTQWLRRQFGIQARGPLSSSQDWASKDDLVPESVSVASLKQSLEVKL